MSAMIFDRPALRRHRNRAAPHVDRVAPVLQEVAERLLDRLEDTTHQFTHALDVGGRGVVAPLLRARGIETISCDLSPAMAARNGGLAVAAAEMAALSAGHWRCSAPGSRNCHPSAAASIAMLMAAISAANAAPSGIVPSPTPLAEKADTHNKPFSLSKRE